MTTRIAPALSHLKDLLSKDDYTSKSISLLEKAEVPSDCTVIVISGPKNDFQQAEVDAIKKYVEDGGRAMFLLDPPLKIGRPTADNEALNNLLDSWGVTVDKDLLLDLSPVWPAARSRADELRLFLLTIRIRS